MKNPKVKTICTGQVRVSFQKSAAILDQINLIQQSPDSPDLKVEEPPKSIFYQLNYSIEEQYQQLKAIQSQTSNLESYLNSQISNLQGHLDQIQSYQINGDYLNQVTCEVEFLEIAKKLCQFSLPELNNYQQVDDFFRLQQDIFDHVPSLNDSTKIRKIMMEFDINYFDSDKCLKINNGDVLRSIDYLKRIFAPPNSHFKIDQMD